MTKFIIYKIYWPTGEFYFGKTKGFRKRRNRHLREMRYGTHHNKNLIAAFEKHGTPEIEKVAYAESDIELALLEKSYINMYKCHEKCCNLIN